ncbi:MAG: caspase family protein [Bacteroidota bacterium]
MLYKFSIENQMMKKLFILPAIILLNCLQLLAQDHMLVVNPKGHKSFIRDMAVSNDKKYLITGGFDKTIKKWDLEMGEVVMEYRSKIGKGLEGSCYFIELSPDNKYLAAGGWYGKDDESENLGDIRIFDYETGKIVQVLKGLGSPPCGLNFTTDSKYIIAGDEYSKIYKWEVATGQQTGTFDYHKFELNGELIAHNASSDRMMSVDKKGIICYWDLTNPKKPLKVDKKLIPDLMKAGLKEIATYAKCPTVSPDLQNYAVALEDFILISDSKFNPYSYIENKLVPTFLKFSVDGKRLLVGCGSRGTEQHAYVYEIDSKKEWNRIADFNQTDASIISGDFIDDSTIVCSGGSENDIYIWSMAKDAQGRQKLLKTFKNNGFIPYAVGLNQGKVAFADVWTANFGMSDFNKEFDLFLKTIAPPTAAKFNRPITQQQDYSIKWCRTYNGQGGTQAGLEIRKGSTVLDTVKRTNINGNRHLVYTFTPDNYIISGGNYGHLEAYDTEGRLFARFVGHNDLLNGLSISQDGKRMITASGDNTIRIWSIENLGKIDDAKPKQSLKEYIDAEYTKYPVTKAAIEERIKDLQLENLFNKRSLSAWEQLLDNMEHSELKDVVDNLRTALDDIRTEFIYPIVSIFMTTDGEWIIWNEKGYFSASKKGAQYIGYYLNQGQDKEAKFFPFEQFDLKYNRPDLILKDLSLGSDKIRSFYYKAYVKRLNRMKMTEGQLSGEIKLPGIKIENSVLAADRKSITINISAMDETAGLDRINVFINDVPVYGKAGIKLNGEKAVKQQITLDLADEKNKIQLSVLNSGGVESLRENLFVLNPKSSALPNLYLVTIGTSRYKDSRFNLKYAAKDAEDMVSQFVKGQSFGSIFHETVTDEQSTKENILKLKEFIEKAGRNDVVMVFIAGHGLLDEKFDYYYATFDTDFNNPAQRGLLYSELEELLDGISALKKLLFMDTCHSGEVDKEEIETTKEKKVNEEVKFRSAGAGVRTKQGEGLTNTSELVKEFFTDLRRGTGSTVISSAGGVEFAMESDLWKNGLFTYCLLNGLSSQAADTNQDGVIYLSELQKYLVKEVSLKSAGKQQPTSRMENITLDYPVWKK